MESQKEGLKGLAGEPEKERLKRRWKGGCTETYAVISIETSNMVKITTWNSITTLFLFWIKSMSYQSLLIHNVYTN